MVSFVPVFIGLVPRVCEELFNSIESKKKPGINYEVSISMLEIYNEKVRDLLNKKKTPHGGLKIKMSKDQGFYGQCITQEFHRFPLGRKLHI